MMRFASATSSFCSPYRSRPNRIPTVPPPLMPAAISRAAASGAPPRLALGVGAGGGGEQQRAVGDRLLDGAEQLRTIQNFIGAGGSALGADVRPAVTRIDDAKPRQRKIAHAPRGHADV